MITSGSFSPVRIVDPSLDVKGETSRCATLAIEHRINVGWA